MSKPQASDGAIGIDLGTSGLRAIAINSRGEVLGQNAVGFTNRQMRRDPEVLIAALRDCLRGLNAGQYLQSAALAIAGTSGSLVPLSASHQPVGPLSLYNDRVEDPQILSRIAKAAPDESPVQGANSPLGRAMELLQNGAQKIACEADFLASYLCAAPVATDVNNALKLGADPQAVTWPDWLTACRVSKAALPKLTTPGAPRAALAPDLGVELRLPKDTQIHAGTTDGCAAALAAGVSQIGDAVSSLGSTLVLKMLTRRPINAPHMGVYSHRLAGGWLVGGASNTGGAILQHFFDDAQMAEMASQIQTNRETGLHYIPLLSSGERFPVSDPYMMPRLTPRPVEDHLFYQGLLESLLRLEAQAYDALRQLGGPAPSRVFTAGGGTKNQAWMALRKARLPLPFMPAQSTDTAYGAAKLALSETKSMMDLATIS